MLAALYRLAIALYALGIRMSSLFNPKAKKFVAGRKSLLQNMRYALVDERRQRIWMHCASLGEFEQGRPVLERLRKKHPGFAYVLTFFSPSGYEVRKDYNGADYVFYLPMDTSRNAGRFLDIVKPHLAIFVKYELWYFYLSRMARRDIPLLLISANFRANQPFFKWYGSLHRRMLHCFRHIFVQNPESMDLLNRIGVEHVTVTGDTRFDRVLEAADKSPSLPLADSFCKGYRVLVAGSTWPKDEEFIKEVITLLPADWKLILVPHEVHEAHIAEIERIFAGKAAKWSDGAVHAAGKRVLIVDRVGLLMKLYRYARITWVGGGFDSEGVHNILEPAVYGVPVAFGPVYDKFPEAAALLQAGGGITPDNARGFACKIMQWETDKAAYENVCKAAAAYVNAQAGATAKIKAYIEEKNLLSVV